ncbi:acyl-CoA dehydrogenase IpdE1 [Mycolicibacterium grossiae]|uniref:Acyl-CoA dehydrogenase n=1 Tax=Mycolicibacterium grossiae TaxID=1552759 RepID=A0A1E8Q7B0_9MYCO|nr:acyl-CoA dehydrogenase IpdE1 [Mycolicibacterium grossiae]OFJ53744.1 acyl-CoA dehydrogenase [Mycolicibacterium grossiae]QEM43868.1 acyl-CoA dehydrogenase [Mycolicibacterium grossiae]
MVAVEEFRAEVRQWLADNLVGEFAALKGLGGPGREHEAFEERLAWNQHLAKAGLTCLGWPVEHGGRGLTVAHRVAFYEEYAKADAPDKVNHLGEELLGPTLIAYGTPEQQQRFLPKILDVTELWSQGYSEPGAGSDLANVATSAELDGDQWIINGQKVWTSLAHWAQWCFVVARTEKGSKRHAGLSFLLVPLEQPGVQIRPIIQLTGDSEFNEVFFDDARTDASLVVGEPGDGWRVAMGLLTFERGVSTLGQQIRYRRELLGLVDVARSTGVIDDPVIRERLTRSWVGLRAMRSYALATMDVDGSGRNGSGKGSSPGKDSAPGKDNVSKLLWANWHRELGEIAMDVRGMAGLVLDDGQFDEWQRLFLFSRSDTIYGGSNEIQRNIIAERVLGLPREAKG